MSYTAPSGGGANYWDAPPVGMFSAKSASTTANEVLVDITGEGFLTDLACFSNSATSMVTAELTVTVEVDGVAVLNAASMAWYAPIVGQGGHVEHNTPTNFMVQSGNPPIKFNTSLKITKVANAQYQTIVVAGRLV